MRLETIFHIAQACGLLRRHLRGRNAGPDLNDLGQQLLVNSRRRLAEQVMQLCFDLENTRAAGCDLRIGFLLFAARRGLRKLVKLRLKTLQFVLKLRDLGKLRRVQIEARAGLVDQIDRLVWQKAVGDIALTSSRRRGGTFRPTR